MANTNGHHLHFLPSPFHSTSLASILLPFLGNGVHFMLMDFALKRYSFAY